MPNTDHRSKQNSYFRLGRVHTITATALIAAVFGSLRVLANSTTTAMATHFLASLAFPSNIAISYIIGKLRNLHLHLYVILTDLLHQADKFGRRYSRVSPCDKFSLRLRAVESTRLVVKCISVSQQF